MFDIGIIGAGPAGMSAAIYAARAGKKVIMFDGNEYGGQIMNTPDLENYPGFASNPGFELANAMYDQIAALGSIVMNSSNVSGIILNENFGFTVETYEGDVDCAAVIIATGCKHRELNLHTEHVYYCATCDGPLFKDKDVIVVGSGNTGATYALELSTYCRNVYLCDLADHMLCEDILKKRIEGSENIQWFPRTTITETVEADNKLQAVVLQDHTMLECSGIFAAIGMDPQTEFLDEFPYMRDSKGFVIADESCITTEPGIFVAGDCRTKAVRQAITAAADGAVAALAAVKYLNN